MGKTMKFRKRAAWIAGGLIVGVVFAVATVAVAAPREAFPERSVGGIDPLEYHAQQEALQNWLLLEMPEGVVDNPIRVNVTAEEMDEVDRRDAETPGLTVVGRTKRVGHRIDFAGANPQTEAVQPFAGGLMRPTDDGGFVWAIAVSSENAKAVRLGFRGVRLPSSADLYVHNTLGQAFGPYSAKDMDPAGDFWAHSMLGPTAIVQVHQYGPASNGDLRSMSLTIDEIGHIGAKFWPAATADTEAFCSQNEPCIENTNCSGGPSWGQKGNAEDATGLMLWISGAFINTCTGGLVADTDGSSQIPYFLTANHCISRGKDARNLETYFGFQVNCGASCPPEWAGGGMQTSPNGATIKSTSGTSDYTLLELNGTPPGSRAYMGWTTANVANADGTNLFRISHPATAPQAYSAQTVDTSAGECQGINRPAWIYSRDTYGATEGGSSGSPVYNGAGQIVGQLTGACGFNPGDPCDSGSNATIDGAFANYYSNVAQFLDPSPCNPSPEICDNNADDDCDGAVDCADSDCSGDPACDTGGCVNPGGAPAGTSCNSNGECCSNKCRGPRNGKTCR